MAGTTAVTTAVTTATATTSAAETTAAAAAVAAAAAATAAAVAAAAAATAAAIKSDVRYGPGGGVYRIIATPADTGNTHFAFEATEPPGGGPPLHIHLREEELFVVLEGEITFYVDGQVLTRGVGQSAFIPRGMPHCFRNCSDKNARVLVMFTPGDIEGFFDYGEPMPDGSVPSDE